MDLDIIEEAINDKLDNKKKNYIKYIENSFKLEDYKERELRALTLENLKNGWEDSINYSKNLVEEVKATHKRNF